MEVSLEGVGHIKNLACRTKLPLMKQAVVFCLILAVKQVGHEIAVGDHR